MNSIDSLDKKEMLKKYGKYLILLLFLVLILIILKGCNNKYNKAEQDLITAATKYVNEKNNSINKNTYIEISKLGEIEGTELCSKASGVLVSVENGNLNYKPYLKCPDYESKLINNKNNFITLNGDEVVLLNKGEVYEEKYYTLKEDAEVQIYGSVSQNPGVYTLTYNAYDDNKLKGTATRIVIVTENDKDKSISGLTNTLEPIITLEGDTNIVLKVGEKYIDPGYKAVDYTDGKISRNVIVEPSKIDTSKPGSYIVVYSVTNSKGLTSVKTRNVTVVNRKSNLNIYLTNETNEIDNRANLKIVVTGNGYNYMYLPNNQKSINNIETYSVSYNGTFTFKIYDVYGNVFTKEILVNNLDITPPSGLCSALVMGSTTLVNVNATDNKGISGYNYILDSNETGFISENNYKSNFKAKEVKVEIKDLAGNKTNIKCDVTIKNETIVDGRTSASPYVIDTSEYKLVSAKNDTLEFANLVDSNNIAQNHPPKYPDLCLSFAYYHSYMLYNGDNLNSMTAEGGSKYAYAGKFKKFENNNKQVVLVEIYNQINAGKPVILHVNGNIKGTSRHYVSVVGYKASVTSADTIRETDLLIIDSYDGKLKRMDTTDSRFMISGYDTGRTTYGYQIFILR